MAKREIELLPNEYQPSKAELEERVHIPATPETVAKALMRPATVRTKDVQVHKHQRPGYRRPRD